MTATAMNDFLQQLHDLVPTFNVASIPRDATGVYASPVHIIAEMLNVTPSYIQKIINNICVNVNANCTKMKVIVNGTEQRNTIMVGNAESIMLVLASCTRQDIATIVARLPQVAPVPQAPVVAPVRPPPSMTLALRAPAVAIDVNGASANDLQDDDAMTIKDTFVPEPTQMVDFVLKLADGSDFIVPVRRDGYVNVTKICQAAGKRLQHWKELDSSKESRKYLQKMLDDEYAEKVKLGKAIAGIPAIALLISDKGGNINTVEQGTFAHPDLAIIIAAWACNSFQFQVSRWIRELMITGKVELGKEKSPEKVNEKLEETFKVIDEDEKLYLREKRCLELSLLRIECDKRQRDDASAEEERAVKRQRDDYEYAKRQREYEAVEEERAAKRQRDDYEYAKRQRDDTANVDKTKEENRMQLVRFDAEMATQAKMSAEDLNLKRLECAKSLVEFNANCLPMITNSLKESLEKNALLRSAIYDIEVNLMRKINKCITGDDSEFPGYQETLYCNDFQTFLREMKLPVATTEKLKDLGLFVSNKYYIKFGNRPEKTTKCVNGLNCQVNTYRIEHKDFIEKCILEFYDQATTSTTNAASVAKPLKDVRSFFGQFNCVNVVNNK